MKIKAIDHDDVDLCRIVCESAAVSVALRPVGGGKVKLTSERSGRECLLDAEILELLCGLTPAQASELVRLRTEQ